MPRLLFLALALFASHAAMAVEIPSAEAMQKLQRCMQDVNQHEMEALEHQSHQLLQEIQSLCKAGKREQALSQAIAFNKKIDSNPSIQALLKCGEEMSEMLPKIALQHGHNGKVVDHVCD